MRKYVTIDLDIALVNEAAIALETKRVSETVHARPSGGRRSATAAAAARARSEVDPPESGDRLPEPFRAVSPQGQVTDPGSLDIELGSR